jgi:hypothetical protein
MTSIANTERLTQRRAIGITVAMVVLLILTTPAPALHGQEIYRFMSSWAVLDFDSAAGNSASGIAATDSVIQELNLLNRYEISGRSDIQAAFGLLGLASPLSADGERRLGRLLGVDAVVTGSVSSITILSAPQRASIILKIQVRDVQTGELINGAWVVGESEPRISPVSNPEAMISEAINNAAYDAVGKMSGYNNPRAAVLIREDRHRVLLSHGVQDGLKVGMSLVITRFGVRIGLVKVVRTETDQAEADVVEDGSGIAAQDVATAVYAFPPIPNQSATAR